MGFKYATNENGAYTQRWNGGEFYGNIGTHFGFYASLRDNGISDILTAPEHLTTTQGGILNTIKDKLGNEVTIVKCWAVFFIHGNGVG